MRSICTVLSGLFVMAVLAMAFPTFAHAQGWGTLEGRVTETGGEVLPGVTVIVDDTNFGTATDADGRYSLRIPAGPHELRFTSIGFEPRTVSIVIQRDATTTLDMQMKAAVVEMDDITVEDTNTPAEAGVSTLEPEQVRNIPTPFKGFQALKALPGVATNNETSNQYSVRGGGFNENLIYINGFEVFMPFRPRQGEQEGLGLFNPDLTDRVTLYAGGFPARYGGKLSSALDVSYHRPDGEPLKGAAYVSLLDAGATASASALDGRLGWNFGVRKAQAQHFFATQELKGTYKPDYADVQGLVGYRFAPGHDIEAFGIWADHSFELDPSGRKTFFGIISTDPTIPSDLQSVWVSYTDDSFERDGYSTGFAGVRMKNRVSDRVRVEHDASYFTTEETETYELRGSSVIYDVNPNDNPDSEEGKIPRGNVLQEEVADNSVSVDTWTAQGRYLYFTNRHAAEAGWTLRQLRFDDRIDEENAVEGRTTEGDVARIVTTALEDQAVLDAQQVGLYVQDAIDLHPTRNRLLLTVGLRTDYFSFNDEWTVSPRLSARYLASTRLTLTGAFGVYYQAPTYRELRGTPVSGESIQGSLNTNLKSQRSIQGVAGAEYFLPRRRLYLRAEGYWKQLDNLVSYNIENVRVDYSGENDSQGYTYGLDLQVRGEFVPGLESWVNYSYLKSREEFTSAFRTENNAGVIARPTDQRHTFSVFVQDYIPTDPTWKLHMQALFGSGLPYTPPIPGDRIGNVVAQAPGDRFSARYPEYRRIDAGVTKYLTIADKGFSSPVKLELTGELLNVFDMTNTVTYTWIPDNEGIWQRVPTRLTPRTINVRMRLSF